MKRNIITKIAGGFSIFMGVSAGIVVNEIIKNADTHNIPNVVKRAGASALISIVEAPLVFIGALILHNGFCFDDDICDEEESDLSSE